MIFHIDMDAFYASIEQRDHPALRGKPVIVGAPPDQRGVVCAASYEARKFGVRSAMPSRMAHRLCPKGIFIRPRMDDYREESRRIMEIVRETGAVIEQVSIDEAYLDLSTVVVPSLENDPAPSVCQIGNPICQIRAPKGDHGDASVSSSTDGAGRMPAPLCEQALERAVPIGRRLKDEIRSKRGLTTSIGIAGNKLLAKIASDFRKPDGLTLISERAKVAFLRPLAVRVLYGVGRVTEEILKKAGLVTVADVQDHPGDLRELIGSFGPVLKRYAFGEDDRPLELGDEVKSISSENTFLQDTEDRKVLRRCLRDQAIEIVEKLQRRRLGARTVQVKIRYGDFTTLTRQFTVEEPVAEASEIYRLACYLLAKERLVSRPLRLLGLGVSGLSESTSRQLALPLGGSRFA
ncbi:MAG: DNA polymerase IV [Verrucomicrobia bacterium]|nr:DNA polymerase IV [Verrucomicrobiota bacterium]